MLRGEEQHSAAGNIVNQFRVEGVVHSVEAEEDDQFILRQFFFRNIVGHQVHGAERRIAGIAGFAVYVAAVPAFALVALVHRPPGALVVTYAELVVETLAPVMGLPAAHVTVHAALNECHCSTGQAIRTPVFCRPGGEVAKFLAEAPDHGIVFPEFLAVCPVVHYSVLRIDGIGSAHPGMVPGGAVALPPEFILLFAAVPQHCIVHAESILSEGFRGAYSRGITALGLLTVNHFNIHPVDAGTQHVGKSSRSRLYADERTRKAYGIGQIRLVLDAAAHKGIGPGIGGYRRHHVRALSCRGDGPGEIRTRKLAKHQGSVHNIRIIAENFHYFGKGIEIHWLGPEVLTVHHLVHGEGHSVRTAHRRHFFEFVRVPWPHEQNGVRAQAFVSYRLSGFLRSPRLAQAAYHHVSAGGRTAGKKHERQQYSFHITNLRREPSVFLEIP